MTDIIKINEVQKTLAEAGFDLETEMLNIQTNNNGIDLPRIRIEHRDSGRHRLFVDYGQSYLGDDTQEETIEGNTFQACVFAEQDIRAMWEEGELLPRCSAIDDVPIVENPLKESCQVCPESAIRSNCKKKVRLWLLMDHNGEVKPYIFNLSPTSLKHWNAHKKRLKHSGLPVVVANTIFTISPVAKNSYKWGEANVDINGIVSKKILLLAKQYRDELDRIFSTVSEKDYDDPGDKVAS